MTPFDAATYIDKTFSNLTFEKERMEQIDFQNCQFIHCKFVEMTFSKVSFTECDFESCDLSLSKFPGCKFSEVSFKNSKLIGINWTELAWPLVKLASPLYFYSSNISHSSFYGLVLSNVIIEACKAHDVDFRESDLTQACFNETDLKDSLFMRTNLKAADFSSAINYNIDPHVNTITNARFSMPDVLALLQPFKIKINEWSDER